MIRIKHRRDRFHDKANETIDPIKRDRILRRLMREYSERKITFEQLRQRDPQSSEKIRILRFHELLGKSHS